MQQARLLAIYVVMAALTAEITREHISGGPATRRDSSTSAGTLGLLPRTQRQAVEATSLALHVDTSVCMAEILHVSETTPCA